MKRRRKDPPRHYNPEPMFGLRSLWWRPNTIRARDIATGVIVAGKLVAGVITWAPENVDPWPTIRGILERFAPPNMGGEGT